MGDWDFLHEMHSQGYSADQIADAAACGYNPHDLDISHFGFSPNEWEEIDKPPLCTPNAEVSPELESIFGDLVESAYEYHRLTNRYLQIWGELGELYAEIEYGIKRHKPHTQGSDGKLGNDFIEIKTISPENNKEQVRVKRAGNFNKLLIVKISEDFTFDGTLIARKDLPKGEGRLVKASWANYRSDHE